MPATNTGAETVRLALADHIPTVELPRAPAVTDDFTWRTHTSYRASSHYSFEAPADEPIHDYERLEHVGDALLGAEITLLVHERYPRIVVGVRSLVKAALVANSTLALISVNLGLPPRLLCASAQAFQCRNNPSIQACMFESYLATLHDEQGPTVLRAFIRSIYDPFLPLVIEAFRPFHSHQSTLEPTMNYIGILMEWKVQRGFAGSRNLEFAQRMNDRKDQAAWIVDCTFTDSTRPEFIEPRTTSGSQSSVQRAKNEAAAHACKELGLV
ncbi:ribonuclease III domain-containing protein [Sporobolomyces koalae]|uniref:ribonuclease III domain-containing protein n=1 Tax=Sporobolomyces koalae TaxID=500713 RepID=UPI00317CD67E